MERLIAFLRTWDPQQPTFPPTLLYNEGWLLRLVLDWTARNRTPGSPLSLAAGAAWFSEALLPSRFLPRYQGDPLAESHTHADGVIGHIAVGQAGLTDLQLAPEATQLVVLEAKLGSKLSAGTKNAPGYDQAARTVACMAEVLRRAARPAARFSALGFYVLAPRAQIEAGVFRAQMQPGSIRHKVQRRVQGYGGLHDAWFDEPGCGVEPQGGSRNRPYTVTWRNCRRPVVGAYGVRPWGAPGGVGWRVGRRLGRCGPGNRPDMI